MYIRIHIRVRFLWNFSTSNRTQAKRTRAGINTHAARRVRVVHENTSPPPQCVGPII